ncbi:izumo sperm-egg fusion protein 1 isoform X12 [Herpailurus yagouaroundi]|uniref:izumo sperm-egg fusion protein 1 isoform X12 n=1 Tax=Herpailurus yagouaroundi TaxID=1608482 RepID=UPI001AD62DDE|nr:izumo sperm-egg fusion protein 1 isoform X12 [Puma yagouaroundi]
MGPQVALLVAALAGCLLPARSCVTCDPRVVAALDALEKEYLPTHLAPERHREVMEKIRQTVRNFRDLPDLEDTFLGVIDEATMETSVLSFLRSVRLIRNSGVADDTFVNEFSWMLTLEKAAFRGYVTRFQREDFCPNKCGTMLQLLLWCHICRKHLYLCRKSTDCGVRQINVHEKEDLVLDCELNWHKLSEGLTNYSFYRVWGSNSETLVYKGKRPTLTKPLVGPEDAGTYRCELGTERHGPSTIIHFEVTVLPQRIIVETTSKSSTFVTQPSMFVTRSSTSGTLAEIWHDLSLTVGRAEYLKLENRLRGRLIGLLIWGFVVLIIGILTVVLCFRPGKVIDSMNTWFSADKAGLP